MQSTEADDDREVGRLMREMMDVLPPGGQFTINYVNDGAATPETILAVLRQMHEQVMTEFQVKA